MTDKTPRGPLGFSRLTDIGPFSSKDVTIEEKVVEEDSPALPTHIDRFLYEKNMDKPDSRRFRREVEVKQKPDQTGVGVLDGIASELAELGEGFAMVEYLVLDNNWGYIIKTEVDERVQRRGVATTLREDAFKHMKEMGADKVYSYPASNAGLALVDDTGFRDTGVSVGPNNIWVKEL